MTHEKYIANIQDGEIFIYNYDDKEINWHGKIRETDAIDLLPISENNTFITLLNYQNSVTSLSSNLLCINKNGKIVWIVKKKYWPIEIPNINQDHVDYTSVSRCGNNMVCAYDYLGFSDLIDVLTGDIIKSVFVK